jgi:hypothetical protein
MNIFNRNAIRLSMGLSVMMASTRPLTASAAETVMVSVPAGAAPVVNPFKNEKVPATDSILAHQADRYAGVIIDSDQLPGNLSDFNYILLSSLAAWKAQHKKGVWLKIPITKAAFIVDAVEHGFEFHHAEKGYVMMTTWLSPQHENKLPGSATHQAGVGCVILKDGKILLVQEKNGPLKGTGVWKMPTGLIDPATRGNWHRNRVFAHAML